MSGRAWAYAGALLGAGVSVAANVAHSYVPPTDAASGWHPQTGAVVGAVFWPVALLVAIEVLARVTWPSAARWVAVRFGGLLPVALVAAVVSYRHLSGLLGWYGEDGVTATLGPVAVDGLMVMATGALLATRADVSASVARLEAESSPATSDAAHLGDVTSSAGADASRRAERDATPAGRVTPAKRSAGKAKPAQHGRPERDADAAAVMRAHWTAERAAGRTPSGAELDRVAGTREYGRKVRRALLAEENPSTTTANETPNETDRQSRALAVVATSRGSDDAPEDNPQDTEEVSA